MSLEALENRLAQLEQQNRELKDRLEIREIISRYCRGLDRLDRELLVSCYHPDAVDDHEMFLGTGAALADWAMGLHREHQKFTQHCITTHTCDLQGDVAHTESYYHTIMVNHAGPPLLMCGGRYIDRFERRNGTWAIADRIHRLEWAGAPGEMQLPTQVDPNPTQPPTRDRTDPSYERPLKITARTAAYRAGM